MIPRDFPLPDTVWSVGHSTHSFEDFLMILRAHQVEAMADVRRLPGSRRHPHFGAEALRSALRAAGIAYLHLPELGGRRSSREDSRNTAWRNRSFRGYADHMESAEFTEGMAELCGFAAARRTAVLCAEALWWRCHRALIADWLKTAGVGVVHLDGRGRGQPHPYTSAARVRGGRLGYASGPDGSAGVEPGGSYSLFPHLQTADPNGSRTIVAREPSGAPTRTTSPGASSRRT